MDKNTENSVSPRTRTIALGIGAAIGFFITILLFVGMAHNSIAGYLVQLVPTIVQFAALASFAAKETQPQRFKINKNLFSWLAYGATGYALASFITKGIAPLSFHKKIDVGYLLLCLLFILFLFFLRWNETSKTRRHRQPRQEN